MTYLSAEQVSLHHHLQFKQVTSADCGLDWLDGESQFSKAKSDLETVIQYYVPAKFIVGDYLLSVHQPPCEPTLTLSDPGKSAVEH
jgi:hypothetical protein